MFKIGDRVRVIDSGWDHCEGYGVVVKLGMYVMVRLDVQYKDFDLVPFNPAELELIKESKEPLPLPG